MKEKLFDPIGYWCIAGFVLLAILCVCLAPLPAQTSRVAVAAAPRFDMPLLCRHEAGTTCPRCRSPLDPIQITAQNRPVPTRGLYTIWANGAPVVIHQDILLPALERACGGDPVIVSELLWSYVLPGQETIALIGGTRWLFPAPLEELAAAMVPQRAPDGGTTLCQQFGCDDYAWLSGSTTCDIIFTKGDLDWAGCACDPGYCEEDPGTCQPRWTLTYTLNDSCLCVLTEQGWTPLRCSFQPGIFNEPGGVGNSACNTGPKYAYYKIAETCDAAGCSIVVGYACGSCSGYSCQQ